MTTPADVRAELVRSRAFIRSADTQLSKSLALLDALSTPAVEWTTWHDRRVQRMGPDAFTFGFMPGQEAEDSFAEARFKYPPASRVEVAFDLHVPDNYRHTPHATRPANRKLMNFWCNDPNDAGVQPLICFEMVDAGWAGKPGDEATSYVRISSARAEPCEERYPDHVQTWGVPLITAADCGRIVPVRVGVGLNGTAVVVRGNLVCAALPTGYRVTCPEWADQRFTLGYLMGWWNGGVTEPTTMGVSNFRLGVAA